MSFQNSELLLFVSLLFVAAINLYSFLNFVLNTIIFIERHSIAGNFRGWKFSRLLLNDTFQELNFED